MKRIVFAIAFLLLLALTAAYYGLPHFFKEPLLELQTDDGPRTVEALKDLPGVIETAMFGRAVHVALSGMGGAQDAIAARLAERGLALQSLKSIAPSLEDAFVSVVRAAGGAPVG